MWLRAMLRCRQRQSTGNPPAGTPKAEIGGRGQRILGGGPEGAPVRAAAEENLPPVKPQANLVQVLVREVKLQGK